MSEDRAWGLVARGLELKLAGMAVLAGLPGLAAGIWMAEGDLWWLAPGIGAAAVPDFIGRCLCLAAPVAKRLAIGLSVVFQLAAIVALAAFAITGGWFEVSVGVLIAAPLQFIAAAFFVHFLRAAGAALGDSSLMSWADSLGRRLTISALSVSGTGAAVIVLTVIFFVVGILSCGFGFYYGLPVVAAVLLPIVVCTLTVVMAMYWAYAASLIRLRRVLRSGIDR